MTKHSFFLVVAILVLLALTACPKVQPTPTPTADLANPASVFCGQNGGSLDMRPDSTGNVDGICVFADGSECDEWSYFRAECQPGDSLNDTVVPPIEVVESPGSPMQPAAAEEISDWWGVIKSNPPGAQFDDYFERRDLGQTINYGIDSLDPAVQAKIKELRDSGKVVHLYGTLFSNAPDVNGSQIQVDRIQ
jgi:putative hemolysin